MGLEGRWGKWKRGGGANECKENNIKADQEACKEEKNITNPAPASFQRRHQLLRNSSSRPVLVDRLISNEDVDNVVDGRDDDDDGNDGNDGNKDNVDPVDEISQQLHQTTLSESHNVSNDEDSHLECPICYCILNTDPDSPDYTGCCIGHFCGHALCESCWKDYRSRRNKVCPVCKQLRFMSR